MGDRAYFLIGGPLMALVYLGWAFCPPSYGLLLVWAISGTIIGAILGAAAGGLVASVAQWHGMMGRIGAITVVTSSLIRMLSSAAGGIIDEKFGRSGGLELRFLRGDRTREREVVLSLAGRCTREAA